MLVREAAVVEAVVGAATNVVADMAAVVTIITVEVAVMAAVMAVEAEVAVETTIIGTIIGMDIRIILAVEMTTTTAISMRLPPMAVDPTITSSAQTNPRVMVGRGMTTALPTRATMAMKMVITIMIMATEEAAKEPGLVAVGTNCDHDHHNRPGMALFYVHIYVRVS